MKPLGKLTVIGVVGAALLSTGAIVARAAIPSSSDGTITACYSSANPALRVIDAQAGATCAAGETSVAWNMGMRWAGQWDDGTGPGKVAPGLTYPSGNRNKVVRMNVPKGKFGCTTPKGLWVSITDSYSYPCVEYPQNWVLLVPDPVVPDTHWVRTGGDGKVVASSEPVDYAYLSSGYGYLHIPTIADLNQCSLTGNVADYATSGVTMTVQPYYGYVLYTLRKADGSSVSAPVNITITCTRY